MKKLILFLLLFVHMAVSSQTCDSLVPFFSIDLSARSDSNWTSPAVIRDGYCCTAIAPDKCIEFEVTISSAAIGVIVHLYSSYVGAAPLVSYNCGSLTPVEDTILFPTGGPHSLTICRPGNNLWVYGVESIPDSVMSISDAEQPDQILFYPNPSADYIIVESGSFNAKPYRILDVSGRVVHSDVFKEQQRIELGSFPSGFYIIEVCSGDRLTRQKIVRK